MSFTASDKNCKATIFTLHGTCITGVENRNGAIGVGLPGVKHSGSMITSKHGYWEAVCVYLVFVVFPSRGVFF